MLLTNKRYTYLFVFLFFFFKFSYCQVEAVIIDNEGWAKGNYIEIGIGRPGSFGARTENKPASFHENREYLTNKFGFIANPQKDNWIDYDGDFFTPGIAEEGFTLEINGVNYSNNSNPRNVSFDIPGKVSSASTLLSSCYSDYSQLFWEGEIEKLQVKRFYNITSDGLFIKMSTIIYNASSETKRNLFFMHSVDPDNNQVILNPYEFNTDMEIISQGSSTNNISFVSASQPPSFNVNDLGFIDDSDGSVVSFYALDSRSRVSYGGFFNRMASEVWNGYAFTTAEGSTSTQVDEAISIAFNLGNIAPDETAVFSYYYILEELDVSFDPPPVINISHVNPLPCEPDTGQIIAIGLDPNENYTVGYTFNGMPSTPEVYTANTNGSITLSSLASGTYSNFTFTDALCENEIDTQIEILSSFTPFDATLKVTSPLFAINNAVEIIVVGDGEFEFRLDEGAYQSSNIFNNIGQGLHHFYIRNNLDCHEIFLEKLFFNYPSFFTPNGDTIHDYWHIESAESLQVVKVSIYNRYGKLLKQIGTNSHGWDGTFNGDLAPTDDYWFTLHYLDDENKERIFNGHFTLKR